MPGKYRCHHWCNKPPEFIVLGLLASEIVEIRRTIGFIGATGYLFLFIDLPVVWCMDAVLPRVPDWALCLILFTGGTIMYAAVGAWLGWALTPKT
jgi:hypothetical protein